MCAVNVYYNVSRYLSGWLMPGRLLGFLADLKNIYVDPGPAIPN